jgi:hypothetical protein
MFSSFARPDSFSTVPTASGSVFMFCAPLLVFGGTECVVSRFLILRARTRFLRYRGPRLPFSCFVLPESFLAVRRASCPVFMIFVPELIFGGTESVVSHFHVLRAWTRFRRYRGRRVPFSSFARPDSSSTVKVSGPVFIFCVPRSITAIPRALGPIFKFCAPKLVFSGTEGVVSCFHVLLARTRSRRYQGRQVPFSSFARPDSFSAVPRASGPVFMFCAPGLVLGGTEGVAVPFHVLCARTYFRRCRGCRHPFSVFARSE